LKLAKAAGVTVHGFRSSFRTWAEEQTAFDRNTMEKALAHVVHQTKVERAYERSALSDKRRRLMDEWSRHCEGKGVVGGADVIAIRRA
jgi:hypothetical protein